MIHQFRLDSYSTRAPWIARIFTNSHQYSNLVLLLPSWISWIQSSCVHLRPIFHPNAFSRSGQILFRWTAPTRSRSSWSQCLTILATIFENLDGKDSGSYERTEGIMIHFRSCMGISFFEQILEPVSRVRVLLISVQWILNHSCKHRLPVCRQEYCRLYYFNWFAIILWLKLRSTRGVDFIVIDVQLFHKSPKSSSYQHFLCMTL